MLSTKAVKGIHFPVVPLKRQYSVVFGCVLAHRWSAMRGIYNIYLELADLLQIMGGQIGSLRSVNGQTLLYFANFSE